jgi:hypothetical protein
MNKLNKENNMKADNIKDGKRIPVTHGEIVLLPVDKMPKGKVTHLKKQILAHSETGHHHILEADTAFDYLEEDTLRAVFVKDLAKLWHNKTVDIHETRIIAPGAYEVKEKTEYNPFTKVIEKVFD